MKQHLRCLLVVTILCMSAWSVYAQSEFAPGDEVVLVVRARHIPGHPAEGNRSVTVRLRSGSTAEVLDVGSDNTSHWLNVRGLDHSTGQATETWIISSYVETLLEGGGTSSPTVETVIIGTWNLEWLHNNKGRGFPENVWGGPSYDPRTAAQIAGIADTIKDDLGASLLMLSEINGQTETNDDTGTKVAWSIELEELVDALGGQWSYRIAISGGSQRVAMIWDASRIKVKNWWELAFDYENVQGKDVFDRDPIAAHVALLSGGKERNDLIVIGVHLASGQDNDDNHDRAMELLRARIDDLQHSGMLGGLNENDIAIMGDYNANAFRTPAEQFFIDMDESGGRWDLLADGDYPPTRLSGTPSDFHIKPRNSQIDYIIVTRGQGAKDGLSGEEITEAVATVHHGLATTLGFDAFRENLSDHLPVTVPVHVVDDSD